MKLIMLLCALSMYQLTAHAQQLGICLCRPSPASETEDAVRLERDESAAVFAGRVIGITRERGNVVKIRFRVAESWKGISDSEVVVTTPRPSEGSCGFRFRRGQSYLVYAGGSVEQRLETTICNRTKKLSEARDDIEVLGKGQPPKN